MKHRIFLDSNIIIKGLISHAHDAPILAAAMHAQPDFLLTDNRRHFNDQVAQTTGLTILSAEEFFTLIQK